LFLYCDLQKCPDVLLTRGGHLQNVRLQDSIYSLSQRASLSVAYRVKPEYANSRGKAGTGAYNARVDGSSARSKGQLVKAVYFEKST
jgi:hypothetical protein